MRRSLEILVAIVLGAVACQSGSAVDDEGTPRSTESPSVPEPGGVPSGEPARMAETASGETPPLGDSTPPAAVSTETISVGGAIREYVLAVPGTYSAERTYPLVLVLHGDGGDGPSMRGAVPFDTASGQEAIVAYPSGADRGWDLYTPSATNADLAFLVALVDTLAARFHVDKGRVFGTGFSSGGFMVNQVGCRRPTFFRAIAPQSGGAPDEPRDPTATLWENGYTRCAGQTIGAGPAVLAVHGTTDGTVLYDSGEFTAKYWAYIDGCAGTRTGDGATSCLRYEGCAAARPVVFCPVEGLGHSVWDRASATIWSFFRGL